MALLDAFIPELPPLRQETDGVVRVGNTRVTLDTVIRAYQDGATAEEITQDYDSLDLADVHGAIGYYLRHRQEVESYLAAGREQAAAVRKENEARFPSQGIRERLLARRMANG